MEREEKGGVRPLYRDIAERTQGEMYIGVVGPVRSGKSTFIANFMEKLVLPFTAPGPKKERLRDEMPQSGSGAMVMTTQPRFIPGEGAAEVLLEDGLSAKVRLVDSVGYLIPGAEGADDARMVSTPWAEHDLPFREAAALGTEKVMSDHATLGIVVTTDGTVAGLPRSNYVQAEEQVITKLKELGKPFSVVLNSASPQSSEAKELKAALTRKYDVPVTLLNVREMGESDVRELLSSILMEFPLREILISLPEWVSALEPEHWLPAHVLDIVRAVGGSLKRMRDKEEVEAAFADSPYVQMPVESAVSLGEGAVRYTLPVRDGLFSRILSEQCGEEIADDAKLLALLKELTQAKQAYDRIAGALRSVEQTGYGFVTPAMSDIELRPPEVMKQGSRYGVRLRAAAPALHLIRSDIETEVAPVLGTQEQSEQFAGELARKYQDDPAQLWETNFFGRSLKDLIQEGLTGKMSRMPADTQEKVQAALTRMLNEGEGGMICILL